MRKRFYFILLKIFILLICLSGINFVIDPYGIFKKDISKQILEPNKNYLKTKYILKNKNKYDAFIFGSSRVGVIPVEKISGYRFYNMTYSEGVPKEWLDTLKTFIENDIKIKMVIIGIDDISFKVNYKEHLNQPMRLPYQNLISCKKILKNYLLINPFNKYNILTLKGVLEKNYNEDYINIYTNGTNITKNSIKRDEEIETNLSKHFQDEKFLTNSYSKKKFISIEENIKILNEIEKICLNNNIKLIVIFNPLHESAYIGENEKEYKIIKEKLIDTLNCNIYDFSVNNSIAKNNYYWYETSHFRNIVGEMMLKIIFKDNFKTKQMVNIPSDFVKIYKK